jgi:hypothetical protein
MEKRGRIRTNTHEPNRARARTTEGTPMRACAERVRIKVGRGQDERMALADEISTCMSEPSVRHVIEDPSVWQHVMKQEIKCFLAQPLLGSWMLEATPDTAARWHFVILRSSFKFHSLCASFSIRTLVFTILP